MDEECLRMKIFEIGETENVRLLGFDVLMIEICMSKEAAAYHLPFLLFVRSKRLKLRFETGNRLFVEISTATKAESSTGDENLICQ